MRLVILLFLLLIPSISHSAISFTNNKWETTFNCSATTQSTWNLNCDAMEWASNYELVPGYESSLTSAANNASGSGGLGARFWKGAGQNNDTGTMAVIFSPVQKELWIRWYMRHQSGFAWTTAGVPEDDKLLFFRVSGSSIESVIEFFDNRFDMVQQGTSDYRQVNTTDFGWTDVMGGNTGDGQWHCYEVYMKMDTNGTNGVGRIWIDGVLRAQNTAVDWSNSEAAAQNGWYYFMFDENQKYVSGGPYSVDYDDMVIYNATPPGRDASNNPYIGPIGGTPAFTAALTGGTAKGATIRY